MHNDPRSAPVLRGLPALPALAIVACTALCAAPLRADAGDVPVVVSPAAPAEPADEPAIAPLCPTLSWSGVAGATGYAVQILEATQGRSEVVAEAELGDARSWTPSRCLDPRGDYAWRVRGEGAGWTGPWSPAAPFRVADRTSLRAALRRVAERLADERRLTADELDRLRQAGILPPEAQGAARGGSAVRPAAGSRPLAATLPVHAAPAPLHTAGNASVHVHGGGTGVVALGTLYGVYAEAEVPGIAVVGEATGLGINTGVYGRNENAVDGAAPAGTVSVGVRGTGKAVGVEGTSVAPLGRGVEGTGMASTGFNEGVVGETSSIDGIGVEGRATEVSGTSYGVRSDAAGGVSDFYAGGAGADYGPFTGSHLVRLPAGAETIEPGMLVSVTGRAEALVREDGSVDLSSTLPTVRLTTEPRDPTVFGAFIGAVTLGPTDPWRQQDGDRIGAVNALGEGRLWVTDANGPAVAGDYLTSSALAGYAQRQDGTAMMPYTVAKAIETVDWSTAETVTVGGRTVHAVLLAVVYTGG